MTFLGEEHRAFGESLRRFLAEADGMSLPELFATAGEQGFPGIAIPEEYGGGGIDDLRFGAAMAAETMASGRAAVGLVFGLHGWVVAPALARDATAEQRARYLPGLADGRQVAAVTGLHPQHTVHGEPAGDGMRLTGTAVGVPGAADADLLVVVVAVGDGPRLVVVELDRVRVVAIGDELGLPGSRCADVVLDGVVVPAAAVLPDGGTAQLDALRADHDLWLGMLGVAGARSALRQTVQYVRDRKVFGRPVAEFENTRRALAEVDVDLVAAEALVEDCVLARLRGGLSGVRATSAAMVGSALHARATDEGLQLFGGYGYMREYPIAQAFADARRLRLEAVRGVSGHDRVAAALGL